MKVSVIIVTFNNEIWVNQCLDSLLSQKYSDLETIWVDNGSKDRTIELVKAKKYDPLKIKLVELKTNEGFAGGNNAGYKICTGDIIFLLNSDARIEDNTIQNVIDKFKQDKTIGIIQNRILLMDDHTKLDSAGSLFTVTGFLKHIGRKENLKESGDYPIFGGKGASLFIKREVIKKTYLFNPYFNSYFEDTDLCWRCWLCGYKVIFCFNSVTYHKGGATGLWLSSGITDYNSFKNRIFCILTCLNLKNLIIVLPIHLLLTLSIGFVYLIRGKFSKSKAIINAIFWNIKSFRIVLYYRRLIQQQRISSDKEVFNLVSSKFSFVYAIKSLIGYTAF